MEKGLGMRKLTLLLVSSLTIMSIITISPALPEMTEFFSDNDQAEFLVKLILTIPALFIAITSLLAGSLIDKYGRLKFLWTSLLLYFLSGTAGFWLTDIYHILVSRAILGIAVGMSMTIVITLVADYFEGAERQKFIGIQVAFMSLGGILFIGIGGALADYGWRFPFLLYILALLVLPLSLKYLDEPKLNSKEVNRSESKSSKIIWLLFINVMLMWILFFIIPVQVPFYLKEIGVEKNALIGIAIALSTAFSAVSAISYSRVKDKLGFSTIFAIGYLLLAAGYLTLSYSDSYGMVVVAMMFSGLGMGFMIPNTNMWVMKIAPPEIRGKEIGKLTFFWFLGQFLSPIVLLPIAATMSLPGLFFTASMALALLALSFFLTRFVLTDD